MEPLRHNLSITACPAAAIRSTTAGNQAAAITQRIAINNAKAQPRPATKQPSIKQSSTTPSSSQASSNRTSSNQAPSHPDTICTAPTRRPTISPPARAERRACFDLDSHTLGRRRRGPTRSLAQPLRPSSPGTERTRSPLAAADADRQTQRAAAGPLPARGRGVRAAPGGDHRRGG
jgi:hypothetical protein